MYKQRIVWSHIHTRNRLELPGTLPAPSERVIIGSIWHVSVDLHVDVITHVHTALFIYVDALDQSDAIVFDLYFRLMWIIRNAQPKQMSEQSNYE